MRKLTIPLLIVLALGLSVMVEKGSGMNDFGKVREERFKEKIGFNKVRPTANHQGVVADWSKLSDWKIFHAASWTPGESNLEAEATEVIRRQVFRRGEESMALNIIVSSESNQRALDYLLGAALSTSRMEPPYQKAEGLGDFYIHYMSANRRALMWVYRNIYFQLRHEDIAEAKDRPFDTLALAREIQQYAEAHLVQNIQNHYPRIARVVVAPEKVRVGDDFTVTLNMEGDMDAKHYGMDFDRSDNLELESIDEGLSIHLRALAPGKGEVRFRVYDARTLLMTQKTVQIDVQEKGK